MNRDIEFRIWADNRFYYKCLVGNTNNIEDNNWTCPMVWLEDKKEWVNCDNGIIQQYTGLKDKNGKKIFEGDIVKINNINYRILYSEYRLSFVFLKLKEATCYFSLDEIYEDYYKENQFSLLDIEVIGNIYENKELLK